MSNAHLHIYSLLHTLTVLHTSLLLLLRQIQFRLNIESHDKAPQTISMIMESQGGRYSIGAVSLSDDGVTVLSINRTSATIGSSQNSVNFVILLCGIGEGWFTVTWEGLDSTGWSVSGVSVKTYGQKGGWTPEEHSLRSKKR